MAYGSVALLGVDSAQQAKDVARADVTLRRSPAVNGTAGDVSASRRLMRDIEDIATASGLKRQRSHNNNLTEGASVTVSSALEEEPDPLALLTASAAASRHAPAINPAQVYFMSTQEWDGYITEVNDQSFEAVIAPVGSMEFVEDTMTVPFDQVDDDVRSKLAPGVLFRFAAGNVRIKRQVLHAVRFYFRADVGIDAADAGLTVADFEAAFED